MSDDQAERLSIDIAHLERMLTAEQMKTHELEERLVEAKREKAGYEAAIKNIEANNEALKARYETSKQVIRNLRALLRRRGVPSSGKIPALRTGMPALVVWAADSLAEGFIGQAGTVTDIRGSLGVEILTVEFPDHSVGKFSLREVELDPQLIASLETAS